MDAITIARNFFTLMSGPLGATIIAVILLVAFIRMAAEHHLRYLIFALIGGAGFFSVAWVMSTILGGSVG